MTNSFKTIPFHPHPVKGKVNLPGSKSLTHRALIAAALASGKSILRNALRCDDTECTMNALKCFGAEFQIVEKEIMVNGIQGHPQPTQTEIFLGQSGTSLRFLLSIAALSPTPVRFTGESRLFERPIKPLITALRSLGATVNQDLEKTNIEVYGGNLIGGNVSISGELSSQFVSSLLFLGPCLEKGLNLEIIPPLVSKPYIELTLDVIEAFGIKLERHENLFIIPGQQDYKPTRIDIEADLSSAGYFWAAAAISKGEVSTIGGAESKHQGEYKFLELLERMGCHVECNHTHITVKGDRLYGISANMGDLPDQVPTMAVISLFADGETHIYGVPHLRHKESDRLGCLGQELTKLGGKVTVHDDGLHIIGTPQNLRPALLESHLDHRLAMSFALLGLRIPDIKLANFDCVSKSFPSFWQTWETLLANSK